MHLINKIDFSARKIIKLFKFYSETFSRIVSKKQSNTTILKKTLCFKKRTNPCEINFISNSITRQIVIISFTQVTMLSLIMPSRDRTRMFTKINKSNILSTDLCLKTHIIYFRIILITPKMSVR